MPKITPVFQHEADSQHPILGGGCGPYNYAILGEAGGLTQFGAHLEILPPGSRSSFRHWHETEDEMVYLLSGEVVLIEETGEAILRPGDTACWPAGQPNGHCLENRSGAPATYLTLGTRLPEDIIHYADHDLITHKDGAARVYTRRDGTPYPQGGNHD
ncbi:cupin domain-containing protein [Phaeovulum sp. W22_SRMD_FR3]|uniref:cupin domain-containing protein n=1 Tax=Phaeovulum sp. W22_SRMD_FR3 TaxID=3240274 RepID=UPI003F9771D3